MPVLQSESQGTASSGLRFPVLSPGSFVTSLSLLFLLPVPCQENLGQAPLYCHLSKEHEVPVQTIVALEQGGQVGPAVLPGVLP